MGIVSKVAPASSIGQNADIASLGRWESGFRGTRGKKDAQNDSKNGSSGNSVQMVPVLFPGHGSSRAQTTSSFSLDDLKEDMEPDTPVVKGHAFGGDD